VNEKIHVIKNKIAQAICLCEYIKIVPN